MSVTINLIQGDITLKDAKPSEDSAAHILTHNQNMSEIQAWIRNFKVAIELLASSSGGALDTTAISELIQASKYSIQIPVGMTTGQEITDSNGFKVKRIGIPAGGGNDSVEFQITDTNTDRNTNFAKSLFNVKQFDGKIVYPSILPNLTNIRIIFRHYSEVAVTAGHTPATTDPNIKIITIF